MPRKQSVFVEVGQVFGRLTVKEAGRHPKSNRPAALVVCQGTDEHPHAQVEKWVNVLHLTKGTTLSCGCLQREVVQRAVSDSPQAVRMRAWREYRNSPDYQPAHRWRYDEDGRECSYSGRGSCGHAYKLWHEYSPGGGPHAHETRCKACMAAKIAEYMEDEPDDVKLRRAERQRTYAKTPAGREANRRARLAYRYGITGGQYEYLLALSNGNCWVHDGPPVVRHHSTGEVMRLAVEHAHDCDQGHVPDKACRYCVRGLACYDCNRNIIARADQFPALAERFAVYLKRRPLLEPGAPAR